jgi:hypothetical protein
MKTAFVLAAIGLATALASPAAHATKSYYIDQLVNYPSPCTQPTLFDDTTALKSRMDAASWTGSKFTDGSAWVQDFRESCSSSYGAGGLDSSYADTKTLAVFSGHGSPATLYFGTAHDTCNINLDNQARLGSMSGSTAAVGMYISCSTLNHNGSGVPLSGGYEWLQQQLGFHNLTGNQTAAYGSFFDDTATKSNAQAWLDRLWDQPAMVISYANGTGNCWDIANSAKLKADIFNSPRGSGPSCTAGQPLYQWCSRWVN